MRDLIKFTSNHAIQGWYLMGGGLNNDLALAHLDVLPICRRSLRLTSEVTQQDRIWRWWCGVGSASSSLIIDTTKVVGYTIGDDRGLLGDV